MNMKTVDNVTDYFSLQFSGDSGQDWMNHVNELERQQASKHLWIPRQFYYALANTLTGKAKETLDRLEKGLERPKLQSFIPTWFYPSQQEWHALNQGPTPVFAHFPFRTKVVIIIYYFQFKFQINTAHDIWDRFTHSMQTVHESLQDWGCRLESYVRQTAQYGIQVSWRQYIHQWLVGTQNKSFVRLLTKAMKKDRHGPPIVYDHASFTEWYQNYKAEALETKRLSQMQSRLVAANRARRPTSNRKQPRGNESSGTGSSKPRSTSLFKTPDSSRDKRDASSRDKRDARGGPAKTRNRNMFSRLLGPRLKDTAKSQLPDRSKGETSRLNARSNHTFQSRKPPRDMSKVVCYNCGLPGHYAKDCPSPRAARGPPIGGRLSSLAGALQDMYQDPDAQRDTLIKYEESLLSAAASMMGTLMDSSFCPVVEEDAPDPDGLTPAQTVESSASSEPGHQEVPVSAEDKGVVREESTPLGAFAAQFDETEDDRESQYTYSDYNAGPAYRAFGARLKPTLAGPPLLSPGRLTRKSSARSISWGDLVHHTWPSSVTRKLAEARSVWSSALERCHHQEGKGPLILESFLMLRAISYVIWLSVYTDLSLDVIVSDFSVWLRESSHEATTKEDSLLDVADEIHDSHGTGVSLLKFDLHCLVSEACERMADHKFLQNCLRVGSPVQRTEVVGISSTVSSGRHGHEEGGRDAVAWKAQLSEAIANQNFVEAHRLQGLIHESKEAPGPDGAGLESLRTRLSESVDTCDFLEAARIQSLIEGIQREGVSLGDPVAPSSATSLLDVTPTPPGISDLGGGGVAATEFQKVVDDRLTVVSVCLSPEAEDMEVSIWSGPVHGCPERGVRLSRRCNRLHTAVNKAKSVIAKSPGPNKSAMLRNLTVYDPVGVVRPEERIKFGLSLGPEVSYSAWLDRFPLEQHSPDVTEALAEVSEDDVLPGGAEDRPLPTRKRRQPSDATPARTRSRSADVSDVRNPTLESVLEDEDEDDSQRAAATLDVVSCACVISLPGTQDPSYRPVSLLERILRDIHNQGSYVPVLAGEVLTSWFHDPGAEMAQISTELYAKYCRAAVPMTILESRLIDVRTTDSVTKVSMLIVMVKGISLFDLSRQHKSRSVCSVVMVNPSLAIHEACTGRNLLMDLHCVTNHASSAITVSWGDPNAWVLPPMPTARLMDKLISRYWERSRAGHFVHQKPEISITAVPVTSSPYFSNLSGTDTDGSSSSVDVQDLTAQDCFASPGMIPRRSEANTQALQNHRGALRDGRVTAAAKSKARLRKAISRVESSHSPAQRIQRSFALANTDFSTPVLLEHTARSGVEGAGQIIQVLSDSDSDTCPGPDPCNEMDVARSSHGGASNPAARFKGARPITSGRKAVVSEGMAKGKSTAKVSKGKAKGKRKTARQGTMSKGKSEGKRKTARQGKRKIADANRDDRVVERFSPPILPKASKSDGRHTTNRSRTPDKLLARRKGKKAAPRGEGHSSSFLRVDGGSDSSESPLLCKRRAHSKGRAKVVFTSDSESSLRPEKEVDINVWAPATGSSDSPGLLATRALFSSPVPTADNTTVREEISTRKENKVRKLRDKVTESSKASAAALQEVVRRQRRKANQRLHSRLTQLRDSVANPGTSAGTVNSAPAKVTLFCSENGMFVGQSRLEVILREASSLGSYLPVVFGDVCVICLYDSGASLTQFDSPTIRRLGPRNLTLVDSGLVDFVSVESKRKMDMKLYLCTNVALLHLESGKKSVPGPVYVVENSVDSTFPGLFGLRSMAALKLLTDHEHGLVRDKGGRPYRLYPSSALAKLEQSVAKWNQKQRALRRKPAAGAPAPTPPVAPRLDVAAEIRREATRDRADATGKAKKYAPMRGWASSEAEARAEKPSSASQITTVGPELESNSLSVPSRIPLSEGLGPLAARGSNLRPSSRKRRSKAKKAGKRPGKLPSHPNFSWSKKRFCRAESTRNIPYFHFCLVEAINPLQSFLMRHPQSLDRGFPHFSAYLRERQDHDLYLRHRWKSLWDQRFRMRNQRGVKDMVFSESEEGEDSGEAVDSSQAARERVDAALSQEAQPGLPPVAKSDPPTAAGHERGSSGAQPTGGEVNSPVAGSKGEAPQGMRRLWDPGGNASNPKLAPAPQVPETWQWDPTPPHLTTPIPRVGDHLPQEPVAFHPDFFNSLQRKARTRWVRDFKSVVQGGAIKKLGASGDYRPTSVDGGPAAKGEATLFLPRPGKVLQMLKGVYSMRDQDPRTAALFLMPAEYMHSEDVQLFLHACCQKGETYRYGTLFRRSGSTDWLQLNQAVTEYWLDPNHQVHADLTPGQQKELDDLLEEFGDCIGDTTTREKQQGIPYVRLPVKEDYEPCSDPPFKKNPKVTQLTIDFVRSLEKRGLISRCTDNEAVFVCNSLCIPKTADRYRFVCTFSGLNKNMLKDPYGMITTDAVMAALEGMKWFTTIDLVDGFFALPLYPADRGYTAFHTPLGLFKWNVLPQGTAASPAIFQRMMDRWFAAYLWKKVIVWIDDLLVFSKTFEEHLQALREIFMIFRQYGLVASRRKLKLCLRSVKYIGFIFGVNGIQTDPEKLSAVHDMPQPRTRKEVRQFLGFANFYRRFMPPNFASIVAPLSALTSEKADFRWTHECTKSFNRIKHLLTTTPVLRHPDFTKDFHIHADGSGKGVGAVLSQYVDGAYRPVAFCSRKLLPHQRHWSPAQIEAYAIYVAVVEKWRYYLSLCRVIVHTDHRNLIWLLRHNHKGMIGRWYTQLNAFDLDLVYVSGKSQVVADPLSRLLSVDAEVSPADPGGSPRVAARFLAFLVPRSVEGVLNAHVAKFVGIDPYYFAFPSLAKNLEEGILPVPMGRTIPYRTWAKEQSEDDTLGPIFRFLNAKTTDSLKVSNHTRSRAQSFRLINGVLHYRAIRDVGLFDINQGWVIAVPASLQERVINLCHADDLQGHVGVRKTILRLRQRFFFRGVRTKVTRILRKCVKCLRAKSTIFTLGTPLSPMLSFAPFRAISIDLYTPGVVSPDGYRYVLTVVCMCTRWVAFYPLKTKYSAEVISTLCRYWFHVHGLPEIILSDRGKEFLRVVTVVCEVLQIHQIKTTPYHPQSNGLCESQHKTLTRELRVRVARSSSVSWTDVLTEISFSMVTTPAAVLDNLSPFNLVFGRKPRLSSQDVCFPRKFIPAVQRDLKGTHQKYVSRLASNLQDLRFRALESVIENKEILRDAHDRKRGSHAASMHLQQVKKGSIVSVHQPSASLRKLRYQWSEPTHLVIETSTNTCTVVNLVTKEGRDGSYPPTVRINRKMMVPFPSSPSFFIGAKARRQFRSGIYVGTITHVLEDEGECLWHVVYEDFDSEDLNFNELVDAVFYHPLLDTTHDLRLPSVGSFVWYSEKQRPRLGQVTGLDPTLPRPVTVRVFVPKAGAPSLSQAVFRPIPPAEDTEDEVGCFQHLHLSQVRASFPALTPTGRLTAPARRFLQACLRR